MTCSRTGGHHQMLTRRDFIRGSLATLVLATLPQPAQAASKKGNLDAYIGLPKSQLVIATAKRKVYVYKRKSTGSKRLTYFQARSSIVVDTSKLKKGTSQRWLKVKLKGKKRGYIQLSKVKLSVLDTSGFGMGEIVANKARRAKVCQTALKYLGTPHRSAKRADQSLKNGISCNHFAYQMYKKCGIATDGYEVAQLAGSGVETTRQALLPGDLVCYTNATKKISHVAIYLGNGFVINASGKYGKTYPYGGVRISRIDFRSTAGMRYRNVIG